MVMTGHENLVEASAIFSNLNKPSFIEAFFSNLTNNAAVETFPCVPFDNNRII